MTGRRIVYDETPTLRRAAVLDADGRLLDLFVDRLDRPSWEGGVFLARVGQILKDRNAAFVTLGDAPAGDARRGLLAAADARPAPAKDVPLGAVLRAGQMIVVQIKADAAGDKAAVVSMDMALAGRLLTHLPTGRGVMASKRLGGDPQARQALRAAFARTLPDRGGWIVRSCAVDADAADVAAEAAELAAQGRQIIEAAAGGGAVRLLRPPPDALARARAAYGAPASPADAAAGGPDLDAATAALLRPTVPLADGGRLIIETTAALTAVDVDGGGRGNPLSVNLAAADEVARQLRLRNIGGVVMVDFIRMQAHGDRERLLARLKQATADDPAQTDVYGLTRLGLAEMTRARRGRSLADTLGDMQTTETR